MKKIVYLLILACSFDSFSQEDARVYFRDKPDAAAFFLNPLAELSQRSLDRRKAQAIILDVKDAPLHQSYVTSISAATGISVKAKSKWLNCIHVRGSIANINALKVLPFVMRIDFANNRLNTTSKIKLQPQQPLNTAVTKYLGATVTLNYGNSANQIQMLNGHLLHQLNYTGTGKLIAVLDDGFNGVNTALPFKRLRDNNQIRGGYDFVNKSSNYFSAGSHGTSVLSTMGGYVAGRLIGTAPDATYYLYITEDSASVIPFNENPVEESYWVEAAEQADKVGADIITSSLGYFEYDNPAYSYSYSDMTGNSAFSSRGANIAFDKGIIVVASAGNSGREPEPHVVVPAEATNVIAVGAVKSDRSYVTFSSIGPSYDGRVKPDVMAQGQAVVLSDSNGNINTGDGTSFACPITAGLVACLWQALPSKNANQIKQLILQSSDNFFEPASKTRSQFGYGIPNFDLALANALSTVNFPDSDFKIYSNPIFDTVFISLPSVFDSGTISFFNSIGQKVLSKNIDKKDTSVSLSSLSSGVYLYTIEATTFFKTGKIIKQ
jgi:serine protease AprX